MDGWMDGGWGVTVLGQASSLLPSSPSAAVIGAPVGVQVPNTLEKDERQGREHTRPHHDPRPLSEKILSAQGQGYVQQDSRRSSQGTQSPPWTTARPPPTSYPSYSPSHGSRPYTHSGAGQYG